MNLRNLFINLPSSLILKIQLTKILDWLIEVFITREKTLNRHITIINLKYLSQLGMMNLIFLMDHIQSQTFRITLNLSSKHTKLWLEILPYKFTPIKSKTGSFLK